MEREGQKVYTRKEFNAKAAILAAGGLAFGFNLVNQMWETAGRDDASEASSVPDNSVIPSQRINQQIVPPAEAPKEVKVPFETDPTKIRSMSIEAPNGQMSLTDEQIKTILTERHANPDLIAVSSAFNTFGKQYNIDSCWAVAIGIHESSGLTDGRASSNKSIGNVRKGLYPYSKVHYEVVDDFRKFDDIPSSIEDLDATLRDGYIKGDVVGTPLTTPEEIIPVYAPSKDDNDPEIYIQTICSLVGSWRKRFGSTYTVETTEKVDVAVNLSGREKRVEGDSYVFAGAELKLLPAPGDPACPAESCGRGAEVIPTKIVEHVALTKPGQHKIDLYNYFKSGSPDGGKLREVGSQFIVDTDGTISQLVKAQDKTIERTNSVWDYNDHYDDGQISIENIGTRNFKNRDDMPKVQYAANLLLAVQLMNHYDIPLGSKTYQWQSKSNAYDPTVGKGVFGHYQLNPEDREDPGSGWLFNFREDLITFAQKKYENPQVSDANIIEQIVNNS